MIEIGIGVLFAVIFVAAYLLVSKFLSSGEHGQSRWRELINQPFCGTKAVNARPSGLFLTTGEMREHHSQKRQQRPGGK